MLGGECVPRLVRVTIAHASFFQGRHPCFFTDSVGVRPGFSRFRVAEYELTFHKGVLLLRLQGRQRLTVQLHLTGTGFCLGAFKYPYDTGRLNVGCVRNGVEIRPAQRAQFGAPQTGIESKAEQVFPFRVLDGAKKADIGASAKRQKSLQEDNYLDHARSVAIRMFPVASTLGIAEGIETALSAHQIYKVNTWATMTSGFMKKFRVPAGVKNLIIFADRDVNSATGLAAATECAHANLMAKNDLQKISIYYPDNGDFNDMLMNGDQVREVVFYKKQKVAA